MKKTETDFLVIGAGIAGLAFAIKASELNPAAKILIVTKSETSECNTLYAQGGIAVVCDKNSDSFEQHENDTLIAGAGLCNREVVEFVVREGPLRLQELIDWGAEFDKIKNKELDLGLEGGHSARRIVHKGDASGQEILQTLLNRIALLPNVGFLPDHFVKDLITKPDAEGSTHKNVCIGARILDQQKKEEIVIFTRFTFLATGGIGQIFRHTTNPAVATGDGIALALRAGAQIRDMEFIQYHPTVFYEQGKNNNFLISEAVRGEGAVLCRANGDPFMHLYDRRKDLAPRDIVSQSIITELNASGESFVYLDCRPIPLSTFRKKFPTIFTKIQAAGIDVPLEMIPVAPAMHYLCGGVETDKRGRSSVKNLYAGGECARTGLHGANRLASNSLLEALVFSHRAAVDSNNSFTGISIDAMTVTDMSGETQNFVDGSLKEIKIHTKDLMSSLGPILSYQKLIAAKKKIKELLANTKLLVLPGTNDPQAWETLNMLQAADLVIEHSLARNKNKGVFFNKDLELFNTNERYYYEPDFNRA